MPLIANSKYYYIKANGKYYDIYNPFRTFTLTINPTPADATVTLTATGYTQSGNSITVRRGTTVSWSVSKTNYYTQSGSQVMNANESKSITLEGLITLLYYGDGTIVNPTTVQTPTSSSKTFESAGSYNRNISGVLSFSSLQEIPINNYFNEFIEYNTGITKVLFPLLTKITGNAVFQLAFGSSNTIAEVDVSLLEEVADGVFNYAFDENTAIKTQRFPSLNKIGEYAFYGTFTDSSIEDIYFNSVNTSSFIGYTGQFILMIDGCSNVTIHFPSNMESTISGLDGYATDGTCFGGTSGCYCVYDLPATT